jgi:hypothetical protein
MTLVLSAKVEEAEVEARSAKEIVQKVRKVNTSSAQNSELTDRLTCDATDLMG